eukprot:g11061.t1
MNAFAIGSKQSSVRTRGGIEELVSGVNRAGPHPLPALFDDLCEHTSLGLHLKTNHGKDMIHRCNRWGGTDQARRGRAVPAGRAFGRGSGNAWADQTFCMDWAKKSYRPTLMRGRIQLPRKRTILLMDMMHAQTTDELKEYMANHCNKLAWFFPTNPA